MLHEQFDHLIRAAGQVLGADEVVVIGSQAILASTPAPPPAAVRSFEVDIAPIGDADGHLADLIDGAIGEASSFQEQFGVYAQGVGFDTAVLPEGWWGRTIAYATPATNGVVARCLEPHDLVVSKLVAGREKDIEFCTELVAAGLVQVDSLLERVEALDVSAERKERAFALVRRIAEPRGD